MKRKQKRLLIILAGGTFLAIAAGFVLTALNSKIVFFVSPSDIQTMKVEPLQRLRLGGLVEEESVKRGKGTLVHFRVTDGEKAVSVRFDDILPDLFSEGQGVIAEGVFADDNTFIADSVLAKHDENYMPREVAEALKDKGMWQGTQ